MHEWKSIIFIISFQTMVSSIHLCQNSPFFTHVKGEQDKLNQSCEKGRIKQTIQRFFFPIPHDIPFLCRW